ncbi:hypothetical protein CLU79DRAFT_718483 [Phycomyces nitens]|nr:hypothetical protein CLU79DRAFT_718483 [Phycomyces nitens]
MDIAFLPIGKHTIELGRSFQSSENTRKDLYSLHWNNTPIEYEGIPETNLDPSETEVLLIYDEKSQTFVLEEQPIRLTLRKSRKRKLSSKQPRKVVTEIAQPGGGVRKIDERPGEEIVDDFAITLLRDMKEILDGDDDEEDEGEEGEISDAHKQQPPVSPIKPPMENDDDDDDDDDDDVVFEEVPSGEPLVAKKSPKITMPITTNGNTPSAQSIQTAEAKRRKYTMASAPIRHPGLRPPPPSLQPSQPSLQLPPAIPPVSQNQQHPQYAGKKFTPAVTAAVPSQFKGHGRSPKKSGSGAASSSESDESDSSGSSGSDSSSESGSDNSGSSSGSSSEDDDDDDFDALAENISRSLAKEGPSAPSSPRRNYTAPHSADHSIPSITSTSTTSYKPLHNPSYQSPLSRPNSTPVPSRGGKPMSLRALLIARPGLVQY